MSKAFETLYPTLAKLLKNGTIWEITDTEDEENLGSYVGLDIVDGAEVIVGNRNSLKSTESFLKACVSGSQKSIVL